MATTAYHNRNHAIPLKNLFLNTNGITPANQFCYHAITMSNLNLQTAIAHHQAGRLQQAEELYHEILRHTPDNHAALHLLGLLAYQTRRHLQAVELLRQAVSLNPSEPKYHRSLGVALEDAGQLEPAIASYQQAIALAPDFFEAHNDLGRVLSAHGQYEKAIGIFWNALILRPDDADAYHLLALALKENGQLDQALAACRQALTLRPDFSEAHNTLGNILRDSGRLDEALAAYRQAITLKPQNRAAHSNLLYTLPFHPAYDAQQIYQEALRWNDQHARPFATNIPPWPNTPDPNRPLRIGYISPNFRQHTNGLAMLPLLNAHDHTSHHIICYSDVRRPDAITAQCRQAADQWHNIVGLSDDQVADLIRQDQIDILVDLVSHMAQNRLLVFARQPAPAQTTYLCNQITTGLSTIDYRISDRHVDPPGQNDAHYTEKIILLPDCYLCFQPPPDSPPVNALPALQTGHITFGSLNNFCKVTPQVLELWSQLLATPCPIHN